MGMGMRGRGKIKRGTYHRDASLMFLSESEGNNQQQNANAK